MKFRPQIVPAVLLLLGSLVCGVDAQEESSSSSGKAGLSVETLTEFNRLDRDGDGGLGPAEFVFTEIGQRARAKGGDLKVERVFGKIDRDHDGKIGLFELAQSQHNRNVRIMDRETSGKFAEFDGDDDGFISREEFAASPSARKALESGQDADFVARIFSGLDLNESGTIGPFEYAQLREGGDSSIPEKEAVRRFARADTNDDGIIDREEFLETPLGRHTTEQDSPGEIGEIFSAIDVNGNGEISAQEFFRARENREKVGVPKVILEDYDRLDRNEDGLVSLREFGRADVARRAPDRNAVAAMFARADANGDQGLALREFFDLRKRIRARAMDRPGGKGGVPKAGGGGGKR